MAQRGRTGTSMGGKLVRRKDLRPAPEQRPVDPNQLGPEARARAEANRAEEAERQARAVERAAAGASARAARDADAAAKDRRVVGVSEAVDRRGPTPAA